MNISTHLTVWICATLFGGLLACNVALAGPEEGQKVARRICQDCHTLDGNSVKPRYPKLAGMHANYIRKQINEFIAGNRSHQEMTPVAQSLNAEDIDNVASWFAAQKPKRGQQGDTATAILGAQIYDHGNSKTGLPSCDGCHSPDASGSARFPRLAGQHQAYLKKQLDDIREGRRTSSPLMRSVAERLTPEEAHAVTTYLSGL